jgi:hypothetical protein
MIWKIAKMLSLVAVVTTTGGCQLLIDNRSGDSGAVVVVPSEEWDAMRQAHLSASQAPMLSEKVADESKTPIVKIEPTPGSEAITFSNYTSASLGGCIASGVIELQHQGNLDDAITLLKNEAFRLGNNQLILTKMNSVQVDSADTITIEARMLTCPLKLVKGN